MEQITSSRLGYNIFNSCLRWAESFWPQKDLSEEFKLKHPNLLIIKERADVNFEEILVGYMWAIFDLLNTNSKYERATRFLFGGYVSFLTLDKKEADEKLRFLEKRFYEYKDLFRKDGKRDYNYLVVATAMAKNITGEFSDPLFAMHLLINIQEFVLMWGKQLDEIEIIDE